MQHSQISTSHRVAYHILEKKKSIGAEQMTVTEIEEPTDDFLLNTTLYTRACWALIDCPDFLFP